MLNRFFQTIHEWERGLRRSFGRRIDTPVERFKSRIHYEFFDHAILRRLWTNFDQIAPGVYRSNHPTHKRLKRARDMGIRTIISLRGTGQWAHHLFEKESCAELGLTMVDVSLNARQAPPRDNMLHLIDLFRTVERPFLVHCKSGADRAGLASVVYLLTMENMPLAQAREHLSFKYLHLRHTKTGVLDQMLDHYAPYEPRMGFEEWLRDHYDRAETTACFEGRFK